MQRFVARPGRYEVPHKGIYRVHQRVANRWRAGRILLAGDAAHLNNPLGALGLNGGLHDAILLGEYLGKVCRGEAGEGLLDRYVRQRRTANIEFVQTQSIANKRLLEEAALRLSRAGATVVDAAMPLEFAQAEEDHRVISCREFVQNFTREIEHHWNEISEDLRNGKIRTGMGYGFDRYRAAQISAARCRGGLAAVFADYDVLLAPAAVGEAPIGWNTGDSTLASPWSLMHTPCMSLPVFKGPNGLPVGAQVIGAAGADRKLFAVGRWIYRALTG